MDSISGDSALPITLKLPGNHAVRVRWARVGQQVLGGKIILFDCCGHSPKGSISLRSDNLFSRYIQEWT